MNELLNATNQTMSSREIAELTGKRHDNVKRTIENCFDAGSLNAPQIEERDFKTEKGNTYKEYLLNKLDSITVVAQLSPQFTGSLAKSP